MYAQTDERLQQDWLEDKSVKKIEAHHTNFRVVFSRSAWRNMYGWCKAGNGEVSGMGIVERKGNDLYIPKVFLPLQYGSSGFTELDPSGLAAMMMEVRQAGLPQKAVRLWWHTHYNFDVFWSGTDVETRRRLARNTGEWNLSIVINQRGEWKCCLDIETPTQLAIDNIHPYILPDGRFKKRKFAKDIEKKVRPFQVRQPRVWTTHHRTYRPYHPFTGLQSPKDEVKSFFKDMEYAKEKREEIESNVGKQGVLLGQSYAYVGSGQYVRWGTELISAADFEHFLDIYSGNLY